MRKSLKEDTLGKRLFTTRCSEFKTANEGCEEALPSRKLFSFTSTFDYLTFRISGTLL